MVLIYSPLTVRSFALFARQPGQCVFLFGLFKGFHFAGNQRACLLSDIADPVVAGDDGDAVPTERVTKADQGILQHGSG